MAAILAALAAIPSIISLLREMVAFFQKQFGDDWPKFLAASGEAFKKLNNAKTAEEKQDAGRAIQDIIKRLGG